jgi:hypothetical protein
VKFLLLLIPISLLSSCGDNAHKYIHYIFTDVKAANYQTASPDPNPLADGEYSDHSNFIIRLEFEHFRTQDSNFSAVDYEPVCKNSLQSIVITSVNDFDDARPAGASLSDYFVYYYGPNEKSVDGGLTIRHYYIDDYAWEPFPTHLDMHLKTPPATTSTHQFIIETTSSDGEVWIDTTDVVTIIN